MNALLLKQRLRHTQADNLSAKTWFLVSLRPVGRHSPLRHAVTRLGGRLIAASPWRIVYHNDPATLAALTDALDTSTLVFTSPEAVVAAHRLIPLHHFSSLSKKWIGIGASTAECIHAQGITQVEFPAQMHSEALIALTSYQCADCIGLITAEGGRDLIAQHAIKTGKIVHRADVYARKPIPLRTEMHQTLAKSVKRLCIAVSSRQAFLLLLEQVSHDMHFHLRNCPIIATSDRLADWLQTQGFSNIAIANSPQPEHIARIAADIMAQRSFL